MKIKSIFFLIISVVFTQNDISFSLKSKFAKDKNSSINSPTYFENLLDASMYFNDVYLYAQLEYSNPPLMGVNKKKLSDLLNVLYFEISKDKYDFKFGNLYTVRGSGLSFNTYADQDIDYDNSIIGFESIYHVNDFSNIYFVMGDREIKYRLSPDEVNPSIDVDNRVFSLGFDYLFENISLNYTGLHYEQYYEYEDINYIAVFPTLLGKYLTSISSMISESQPFEKMKNYEHNFGLNYFDENFTFDYAKSIVYYDKFFDTRVKGSREYLSIYFNINDYNIIVENKNYNTPYLFSSFSNPPVCYIENNSILGSRNAHTLNFNNEYGYQIEINKSYYLGVNENQYDVLFSYAFAMHNDNTISSPGIYELYQNFFSILTDKNKIKKYVDFYPYRQIYLELSGWDSNYVFYYKLGYDYYNEYLVDKTIEAHTLPSQFAYTFDKGNSISIYLEYQDKVKDNKNHYYWYFSPTYSHYGKWSVSLFYDYEQSVDDWIGSDFTWSINSISKISLFYGSQKGGLVCANGSCVMQPDFDEGFKVSYSTSF